MKKKVFEIGQEYSCAALYGGEYRIKVVDRTETTISFIFDERTSDDRSIQVQDIIVQEENEYDEELNVVGIHLVESLVAWEYHSQYAAPGDNDYGYYFATTFQKERFAILEANMERLEKKLTTIQNKCKKFGCFFSYNKVGEEFRTLKDEKGIEYQARFILIEAEGKAVINDWMFIASVEHTEKGNIINSTGCGVEVPSKYYNSEPFCEHCNSKRARKDTYIVMNQVTGEFKQVGKSCLKDFTQGMDAAMISKYYSFFDELIKGEEPVGGCYIEHHYDTKEFLAYAYECIRCFGYAKRDGFGRSTCDRAFDYWCVNHGFTRWIHPDMKKQLEDEMQQAGFNPDSESTVKAVEDALAWIAEQEESNNYMHNLKVACSLKYVGAGNLGIVTSLFPTWNRELEHQKKQNQRRMEDSQSEHVGTVGQRITFKIASATCLASWETEWGISKLFKIVDESGNVFTWKTSVFPDFEKAEKITGTIKAHSEFRDCKQTELTRCKVA